MIKILHSLFSLFLGSRTAEYLPCQVLFENSNGKSGYFDLVSWFWPSAIAGFKNDRAYQDIPFFLRPFNRKNIFVIEYFEKLKSGTSK